MAYAASYQDEHTRETAHAYPALKREFLGKIVRLESTRRSGLSDFILIGRGVTTFAEIKALTTDQYPLTISAPQCEFLDDVNQFGGRGRLLVLCAGAWYVGAGPFLATFMLGSRNLYDYVQTRLDDINDLARA